MSKTHPKQLGIWYVYPRMRWPGSFKFKKAHTNAKRLTIVSLPLSLSLFDPCFIMRSLVRLHGLFMHPLFSSRSVYGLFIPMYSCLPYVGMPLLDLHDCSVPMYQATISRINVRFSNRRVLVSQLYICSVFMEYNNCPGHLAHYSLQCVLGFWPFGAL